MNVVSVVTNTVKTTAQEVAALRRASELLNKFKSWTVFTHQKVDGDAMGSVTALIGSGISNGKQVTWVGSESDAPDSYQFLEHAGDYKPHVGKFVFDNPNELYVFLDCSNLERSITCYERHDAPDITILNIDHHDDNSLFGTVNCVDPLSSSTSEVVFHVLRLGGWPLTKGVAESLYTGMWTDSGGFAYSNTSSRTHRFAAELIDLGVDPSIINDKINQTRTPASMALWGRAFSHTKIFGPENVFAISWISREDFDATGARESDTEGLSSTFMKLRGVHLSVFLRETATGVRLSFRSREGIFPASDVAHTLGGGGHPRAAGATMEGSSLDDAIKKVPELLEKRYAEWAECRV